MSDEYLLRTATAHDQGFLFEMLVEAANWHPQRSLGPAAVAADPRFLHYVEKWQRLDDLGVIAEAAGRPIGACWLRYFPADDPGYGYVADDFPELSIAVVAPRRRSGVGRALIREVAERARAVGVKAISLSVERTNFAQGLYISEGFEVVTSGPEADTMLMDLWGAPSSPSSEH